MSSDLLLFTIVSENVSIRELYYACRRLLMATR